MKSRTPVKKQINMLTITYYIYEIKNILHCCSCYHPNINDHMKSLVWTELQNIQFQYVSIARKQCLLPTEATQFVYSSHNSHSLRQLSKGVKAKHPPWTPVRILQCGKELWTNLERVTQYMKEIVISLLLFISF